MKKNKFLKLASGLLVLCLLTTCVISTTFAKYVTEDSASDTARVAKWGVTVDVEAGTDAWGFKTSYDVGGAITVEAGNKVVAPGTNGTLAQFKITGAPEVDVDIKFDIDETLIKDVLLPAGDYDKSTTADLTDGNYTLADDYYPVVYTLINTNDPSTILAQGNLNDIVAEVESLDLSQEANANLADLGVWQITWEWIFNGNDEADTSLGNVIAGKETIADAVTEIAFNLTITVTQID
ncbi:MAG: hypothetical protein IJX06_04845 [Clostridia bacterium]|nr:hypothetical protein [Clostridia bacterium]